ncbi:MAG: leucine-rich repeat domain-containing protein [Spirochaetes bacterium]|nr:leucine-rich repeat domain-containing protein [Spirochaetota bacterium]
MKHSGTIVNLLFALFILFYEFFFNALYSRVTGGTLQEATREVIYGGRTDPVLGAVIVAAVAAEFIGILLKKRAAAGSLKGGFGFFLWTLHTAVTTIMVMTASKAFGADLDNMGFAAGAALFANIIKELALLGILWYETPSRLSMGQNIAADACILFFYCTGFSTGWNVISLTPGSNLHQHLSNIPILILYTILAMILFLVMYLPLRIGYYLTERIETNRDFYKLSLSIATVTIAAMIPLFRPLDPAALKRYWPAEYEKLNQPKRAAVSEDEIPAGVRGLWPLKQALLDRRIKFVQLQNQNIRSIDPIIGKLTTIQSLNLNDNKINGLPPEFTNLASLASLYLARNGLMEIPPQIFSLKRLMSLDLSGNRIARVPEEIRNLQRLAILDFSNNRLSEFPASILSLTGLYSLDLSGNGIASIPAGISRLENCAKLDISHNRLTRFPAEVLKMKKLKELDITGNPILDVPSGLPFTVKK